MIGLTDLAGQELKWTQPSAWKMNYELQSGTNVIGKLKFRSSMGSLATGECAEGRWTFKRIGFLQTRVTIRRDGDASDLAVFRNNTWTGGGSLELPDGRKFFATSNFWQSKLEVRTAAGADGKPLIGFQNRGLLHTEFVVKIHPEVNAMPELPWILMLGCYLAVMLQSDSMAATMPIITS